MKKSLNQPGDLFCWPVRTAAVSNDWKTERVMKNIRIQVAESFFARTILASVMFLVSFTATTNAAGQQVVHGHVPEAIARLHLQPIDRLPATNHLHLAFILPQRNQEALGKLVKDIYDRSSANFHRYLTPAQFNEEFAPSDADYQAVIGFAKAHGLPVTHRVAGRTIVEVDADVADIEQALHIKLFRYQHPTENRQFFAPDVEPSPDLGVPLQVIRGLNNYVIPRHDGHISKRTAMAMGSSNTNLSGAYDASDLRNAFVPDTHLTGAGQKVGLFEEDGYTPADILAYEAACGLANVYVQYVSVNGATNDINSGNSETIDIDMAIAMAPGLSEVVYYQGNDANSILTEMADPSEGEPLPLQLSCSWGHVVDSNTDSILMRFAAQGQSFFGVSGDGGARNLQSTESAAGTYQTVVGGTDLSMNGNGVTWSNETVWGNAQEGFSPGTGPANGSGGGFIPGIPMPDYQLPVNMTAVGGSATWRNFPDVAMPADNIFGFLTDTGGVQGKFYFSGTSYSTPLWAGFAALVNEQAANQGKPPAGFLNPAIYSIAQSSLYGSCFHDITVGNNTWSNSPDAYFAAPGYDLCTGWGSPAGQSLINALVSLSGPVFVDFTYTGTVQNGSYFSPYKTLAQGTNAVSPGGTIFIINGGSSPETMTISKPMTITAQNGAATVGN
jgi:subtilase family serine protease